jgi:RHH-type transcriptional regulator, proline utilization regulon repressor / proline dehydrogenase / delta 1-pyrroline-5-carboxylate dehydrogenase
MTADIIRAKANDLTESKVLPGPTGEENILSYTTAGAIGILASQASRSVTELAALACELGNEIVVVDTDISTSLRDAVQALGTTPELASMISYCSADQARTAGLSVLLAEADHPNKEELRKALAQSEGAITLTIDINQFSLHPDNISSLLPHLYEERTKTDNLIARGGNTQLFNLDE